jgi:predicted secreted protein
MAKQIIQNPSITLNGTAMHANISQVTINLTAEDVDQTNFGSLGWKERTGGLKDGSISFEFQNDYAAAALDSQMFPLLGTSIPFVIQPASTATASSSNPKYSGTLVVTEYSPADAAVGDLATFSVTYPTVGVVTRGTV